jgi:hypothetical protein
MNPPNATDPQAELVAKLKEANNILVTVSTNPSVDQLSAAIGLTILLNKLKKHATAVFSGIVPSTIEFLKPEETLEKNTDSLRDFIIALDKAKADKLRYKVEENIVKIFITPYKTSISEHDLDFSQGDFNVDVVVALGVHEQQDLDQAITAHGRILHDAVVISVNTATSSELGVINWTMPDASSLSELVVEIADTLAKEQIDSQIATALLTGIVAETERFSNEKTSPETMRLSAELMAAGANQQLVASELAQPGTASVAGEPSPVETEQPATPKTDDGTLEIVHPGDADDEPVETEPTPEPVESPEVEANPAPEAPAAEPSETVDQVASSMPILPPSQLESPHRIVEPPTMSGQLTANSESEDAHDTAGGLPLHEPDLPILNHDLPAPATTEPVSNDTTVDLRLDDAAPKPAELPELELPKPLPDVADPGTSFQIPPAAPTDFQPLDSEPTPPIAPAPASTPAPFTPLTSYAPTPKPAAAPVTPVIPPVDGTLADIEQAVHSPHAATADTAVEDARNAVLNAINSVPAGDQPLPPKEDLAASGYLKVQDLPPDPAATIPLPPLSPTPAPTVPLLPDPAPPTTPAAPSSVAPPPVPPPMTDLPPFGK